VIVCWCALSSSRQANAAIDLYSNRLQWLLAAGPADYIEDFNRFTSDISFRIADGPVALRGYSLAEIGPVSASINHVDASPFRSVGNDINNTTYASITTDFGNTFVELRFTQPARGFGGDFRSLNDAEQMNIDVFSSNGTLLTTIDPSFEAGFSGFVATGGEAVGYLRFRSTIDREPNIVERFGMDNTQVLVFPEPSVIAMLIAGASGFTCRRKRWTLHNRARKFRS
jgi:hypothetical protein